jgi:hypothetical protein
VSEGFRFAACVGHRWIGFILGNLPRGSGSRRRARNDGEDSVIGGADISVAGGELGAVAIEALESTRCE